MNRVNLIGRFITIACVFFLIVLGPGIFSYWSKVFFCMLSLLIILSPLKTWETLFGVLGLWLVFGFFYWKFGDKAGGIISPAVGFFEGKRLLVWFLSACLVAVLTGLITKGNTKAILFVVLIWSIVYFFTIGGTIPDLDLLPGNSGGEDQPGVTSEDDIFW